MDIYEAIKRKVTTAREMRLNNLDQLSCDDALSDMFLKNHDGIPKEIQEKLNHVLDEGAERRCALSRAMRDYLSSNNLICEFLLENINAIRRPD